MLKDQLSVVSVTSLTNKHNETNMQKSALSAHVVFNKAGGQTAL